MCIVATPPCDLRWHKHQQKGHRKFCSGLPGAMLTAPFTNSVRKRRSLSDADSWRSYEQCLFFSCFVAFMWTWTFVWTFVCPSVLTQPPSLFYSSNVSVFDGFNVLFLLNICMHRSLSRFIAHNPQCNFVLDVWAFRRSNSNQHQNFKTFRRTWSCKGLPRLWGKPSRELQVCKIFLPPDGQWKIEGCEHPSDHKNSNKNMFRNKLSVGNIFLRDGIF